MKTNQITFITITAVLLFTLVGCEEPKGYLERKEPKSELKGDAIHWNVSDVWKKTTDKSGNLVDIERQVDEFGNRTDHFGNPVDEFGGRIMHEDVN